MNVYVCSCISSFHYPHTHTHTHTQQGRREEFTMFPFVKNSFKFYYGLYEKPKASSSSSSAE
jgi:hypothetical protein